MPLLSHTWDHFKVPILAPILANPLISWGMIGMITLHFSLVFFGLPGWNCPIQQTLGIPCPGCGLSRAVLALVQGDWHTSLFYHLFAPIFLIGFGQLLITAILAEPLKSRWVERVARLEYRTGASGIILFSLVLYWLIRLLFFREAFISLISK